MTELPIEIHEVTGENGELLGHEIYGEDGKLIEFVPFEPAPTEWIAPADLQRGLLDPVAVIPVDTCCGCGGCFKDAQ